MTLALVIDFVDWIIDTTRNKIFKFSCFIKKEKLAKLKVKKTAGNWKETAMILALDATSLKDFILNIIAAC